MVIACCYYFYFYCVLFIDKSDDKKRQNITNKKKTSNSNKAIADESTGNKNREEKVDEPFVQGRSGSISKTKTEPKESKNKQALGTCDHGSII